MTDKTERDALIGKLSCLASLLQQLNAQTANAAVREAIEALAAPAEGWKKEAVIYDWQIQSLRYGLGNHADLSNVGDDQLRLVMQAALLAPAEGGQGEQWKCRACGSDSGLSGRPYWAGIGSAHDAEAIWQCDECKHEHTIALYGAAPPAASVDVSWLRDLSDDGLRDVFHAQPELSHRLARALIDSAGGAKGSITGGLVDAYMEAAQPAEGDGAVDDTVNILGNVAFADDWFSQFMVEGVMFLAPLDNKEQARHILAAKKRRPAATVHVPFRNMKDGATFEDYRDQLAVGNLTAVDQMAFDNLLHDFLAATAVVPDADAVLTEYCRICIDEHHEDAPRESRIDAMKRAIAAAPAAPKGEVVDDSTASRDIREWCRNCGADSNQKCDTVCATGEQP